MAKQGSSQLPMISVSVGMKELITIATIAMSPFAAFMTMLKTTNDAVVEVKVEQKNQDRRMMRIEDVLDGHIDRRKLLDKSQN